MVKNFKRFATNQFHYLNETEAPAGPQNEAPFPSCYCKGGREHWTRKSRQAGGDRARRKRQPNDRKTHYMPAKSYRSVAIQIHPLEWENILYLERLEQTL